MGIRQSIHNMDATNDTATLFTTANLFWLTSALGAVLILYQFYEQWVENYAIKQFNKQHIKYVRWGNLFFDVALGRPLEKKIHNMVKKEGSVFGLRVLGTNTVTITDPDLVQQVLSKNFSNFMNRRQFPTNDPIFKNMLFLAENDAWKRYRTIMTPTFAHGKIKLMKGTIEQTSECLIKNMNEAIDNSGDGVVEIKNIVGAFTMDTIIQIAFGIKIDSLIDRDNPILVHAKSLFQQDMTVKDTFLWTMILLLPKVAMALNLVPFKKEMKFFSQLSDGIIQKKRKEFELANKTGDKVKPTNFIELMVEADYECNKLNQLEGKPVKFMTIDEIVAQCVLFFTVGFDTTAMAISMACYELAKNPKYQELIYEEIQQTYAQQKTETGNENLTMEEAFNIDVLAKMPYLNGSLSESLRLHNPVVMIERRAVNDITLTSKMHDIDIRKDDIVNIPVFCMHRDPKQFDEPLKFKPERFINEKTFHDYSYLPFGGGPRTCIGKPLAYFEARIALLKILTNFKFSTCSKTLIPMQYYNQGDIMISKDVHLTVEKRK